MQEVLAVTLASMQQDMSRLDQVAVNLANVATPGYKREVLAVQPFVQMVDAMNPIEGATTGNDLYGGEVSGASPATSAVAQAYSDTRPGTLKLTGEPFDVAILGDGVFEVQTENGLAYTRQGNFRVDARGRLVTAHGDAVMGRSGDIYLTTRTPVIDMAGNITEPNTVAGASAAPPGAPVAQLKLVHFDNANSLTRLGNGLVAPGSGMIVMDEGQVHLRQGALENSNVSSMHEMVQLIQTMRHFESMQKIAQGYDEMLQSAIHKLGDLS